MRSLKESFHKASFRIRHYWVGSFLRVCKYRILGMEVGTDTTLGRGFHASWPQCVTIGKKCLFEPNIVFKIDVKWSLEKRIAIGNNVFIGTGAEFNISHQIKIGDRCLIASGCKFVDHDHGFEQAGPIAPQIGKLGAIEIQNDVWLGANVLVLRGVKIGAGSVIGAGAVVTKNVPPNQIWAGVPAKMISERL